MLLRTWTGLLPVAAQARTPRRSGDGDAPPLGDLLAQARGAEQVPDSRRPAGKENVGALDMDTLHWAQKRTPNTHIPGERKMSRQDHQCLELETAGSHQIPMHPCINDYLTARRNETVGNTLAMNSHILPPAAVDTTIAA